MSTSLIETAESTAHSIAESITGALATVADDARDKLEAITPHRRPAKRAIVFRSWPLLGLIALVVLGLLVAKKRRSSNPMDHLDDRFEDADLRDDYADSRD